MRRHCEISRAEDLQFCLVDFGIAKKLPTRTAGGGEPNHSVLSASGNGRSRVGSVGASNGFRGTTTYASVAAHAQLTLGRRDDLWSLLFVFVDLLCGHLPWSAAARSWKTDKTRHILEEGGDDGQRKRRRVEESAAGGSTFKDDVFALKRRFTEAENLLESDKKAYGGGNQDDAMLTGWVLEELRQFSPSQFSALFASNDTATPSPLEAEGRCAALRHCLNTFVFHLQVRRTLWRYKRMIVVLWHALRPANYFKS